MADTYAIVPVVAPAPGHKCALVALEINGTCDFRDHVTGKLLQSNRSTAAKVLQMLGAIAQNGPEVYLRDRTQMEPMGDALFELKPKDQRVLLFQSGVTWVIVSARTKPKGKKKVQDAWIQEGKRRKKQYEDYLSQGKIKTL